jgi:hypothetical protein
MVINSRRWLAVSSCFILLLLGAGGGCFRLIPITSYSADYKDKRFEGGVKKDGTIKFWDFASGGPADEPLADVYLRFSDGSVVPLKEMSEDVAKTWALRFQGDAITKAITEMKGGREQPYTDYRVDEMSSLSFRNGKLIWCIVGPKPIEASPFKDVGIGPTAEGPFVSLPVSREDLVRVFGKHGPIKKHQSPQPH